MMSRKRRVSRDPEATHNSFSSVIVLYSVGSEPSKLLSCSTLRQPEIEPMGGNNGGEEEGNESTCEWAQITHTAPWDGRR